MQTDTAIRKWTATKNQEILYAVTAYIFVAKL